MTIPLPLTQVQLDGIENRHAELAGSSLWLDGDDVAADFIEDIGLLLDERRRLAGQLVECWTLLGRIVGTYEPALAEVRGACAGLLRKQKAPGHK